jgi:hypothetical protein
MIELHERLSEFSYSYGVTQAISKLLASIGIQSVPFLPSLLDEAELGFDVGFRRPGSVLLLQFKLGQSLKRFRRSDPSDSIPYLDRPFWRFWVNTAEPEGQYETLLKAENDGGEVYYSAPRFTDWLEYLAAFEREEVLNRSLLVTPSQVRRALDATGAFDGWHRVNYDVNLVYVCSEPIEVQETRPDELAQRVEERLRHREELRAIVRRIFAGLKDRHSFCREIAGLRSVTTAEQRLPPEEIDSLFLSIEEKESLRRHRVESFLTRARSEDDAIAAALGVEAWSLGIQTIYEVPKLARRL